MRGEVCSWTGFATLATIAHDMAFTDTQASVLVRRCADVRFTASRDECVGLLERKSETSIGNEGGCNYRQFSFISISLQATIIGIMHSAACGFALYFTSELKLVCLFASDRRSSNRLLVSSHVAIELNLHQQSEIESHRCCSPKHISIRHINSNPS